MPLPPRKRLIVLFFDLFCYFSIFFFVSLHLEIFLPMPLDMCAINCANDAEKVRHSVKLWLHFRYVGVF